MTRQCTVFTFKSGLLSAVAHDLEIEVTKFELHEDGARVTASFDASSLRVVEPIVDGQRAPGVLSASDKKKIEATIAGEVLEARRFPTISFDGTRTGDRVEGTLTIKGTSRPLTVTVRDGVVETLLQQPDYGITPYSAMFGTLKLQPQVRVRLTSS